MENIGDQHQVESLRQGMRQNIEGKHLHSFGHACVLDGATGQRSHTWMFYHGCLKVLIPPTAGKSKTPKPATDVEESLRAAQGQPLYEVRRNLPRVMIKGLEQPLGSLWIRKERLGDFWPLARSQNIRERRPKFPGIVLCQE